jgi:hypothetical protein
MQAADWVVLAAAVVAEKCQPLLNRSRFESGQPGRVRSRGSVKRELQGRGPFSFRGPGPNALKSESTNDRTPKSAPTL